MKKSVLVPLANGFEEIEAMTVVDILRRAGAEVTTAGVPALEITAAHGVTLIADRLISECVDETYDMIVLPGGMPGAENLRTSEPLTDLLVRQRDRGGYYAAICAAPAVVLGSHGLLDGLNATCYPGFSEKLKDAAASEEPVVVDGPCITSRGPATAMAFALTLVEILFGKTRSDEIASALLARHNL